ncbi:hypothetical protein KYK29_05155 [Shinella daejeonensis]|uniref:hypothetical protein n=1 Tax=Shinella daejeonensis TaxID=659017 RepID=UPI0020C788B3|nr:hypothetical protein [Shinella daejeonensis]MCP8894309.1 hypothetical protein [Shinella daejeonensis]
MIGILDAAKLAGGALLGAAAVMAYVSLVSLPAARSEGRARLIAEQAAQSQREELERKGDDAKIQRMSDYDLCIAYLGRVSDCNTLRVQPVHSE